MSQFRTYFYDLDTRQELKDYEHNGKTWLQTSGMVIGKDGKFVQDTCDFVRVAKYASMDSIKGDVKITADSFPGKRIAVKIWYDPDSIEWRKLVKREYTMYNAHIHAYLDHKERYAA